MKNIEKHEKHRKTRKTSNKHLFIVLSRNRVFYESKVTSLMRWGFSFASNRIKKRGVRKQAVFTLFHDFPAPGANTPKIKRHLEGASFEKHPPKHDFRPKSTFIRPPPYTGKKSCFALVKRPIKLADPPPKRVPPPPPDPPPPPPSFLIKTTPLHFIKKTDFLISKNRSNRQIHENNMQNMKNMKSIKKNGFIAIYQKSRVFLKIIVYNQKV